MPTKPSNHTPSAKNPGGERRGAVSRGARPLRAEDTTTPRIPTEPGIGAAVLYLRGDPTQFDVARRRARQMQVPVVMEFVDATPVALSVNAGPEFRRMLAYTEAHPDVRYLIVPERSCISHDHIHVTMIARLLANLKTTLVFADEEVSEDEIANPREPCFMDIMHAVVVAGLRGPTTPTTKQPIARNARARAIPHRDRTSADGGNAAGDGLTPHA
ncbi:MAG: recombinase family protein [Thermomicrobiales bacterium]